MSKDAGLGETLGRVVSPQYYKGKDTIDARLAESSEAMGAVAAKRGAGVPVTDADRAKAQQGWEDNRLWGKINDAYEKNYKDWSGKWFHPKGDDYGNVVRRSFSEARDATGSELGTIKPDPRQLDVPEVGRDLYNRDAKLSDYGNTKQAAEGTVPSAEASMPAHEESHDTHGNEVNPFEKVVKAYNAYKAKKGFKEETSTVEPDVTGDLPPAPANLVHEWYAKEHTGEDGMERMASVMEKGAMEKQAIAPLLLWPLVTVGVGGLGYGAYKGYQGVKGYKETFDTTKQYIDEGRKGLTNPDGSQMTPEQFGTYVKDTKAELDKTRSMLSDVRGMCDKAKGWYDKYINGNQFGNFLGLGGKNWQWGLGALGLAGAGYGLYKMFSGGGGSGGGWGGGAANSSAYYRNRHGYNRPDYEGMMVDNMMARRGGYGY